MGEIAIEIYRWTLETSIWIPLASYILLFSILFNATNTITCLVSFVTIILRNQFDHSFFDTLEDYVELHNLLMITLGFVGTVLGIAKAFYVVAADPAFGTDVIIQMFVSFQYAFVSTMFGFMLGGFWGVIVAYSLKRLRKLYNKITLIKPLDEVITTDTQKCSSEVLKDDISTITV